MFEWGTGRRAKSHKTGGVRKEPLSQSSRFLTSLTWLLTSVSNRLLNPPPFAPVLFPTLSASSKTLMLAEQRLASNNESLSLLSQHESTCEFDQIGFNSVKRDPESWAGALPANQGLYENENDRDSCGVGFICQIKGVASHKIVSDARQLLCAMTHRGATGADSRDGDGAGVMTGIPHEFFKREAERDLGCLLPEPGKYAVGNVFFNPTDESQVQSQKSTFTQIAKSLGLRVLGWRKVPTDGSILGPASKSKEPAVWQPFVVLRSNYGDDSRSQDGAFDEKHFERQLYVLRKHATHTMFVVMSDFVVLVY